MKRMVFFLAALFIMALPLSVSADPHHHEYNDGPQQAREQREDVSLPFHWHERRENFVPEHHRMERIEDHHFVDRFGGMHPYRWHDRHGEGFMYHGHRIHDAVFFYDDADELISIGFMQDGVFVRINADSGEERSHDSFFASWMQHH